MPDRTRNAIVDLTAQIRWIEENDYHKFPGWQNVTDAMREAVALLKEQEAVEPYSMNAERTYGICPRCGKIIFRYGNVEENHYCGVCGKAVKWN
jgi:hypothetical protein